MTLASQIQLAMTRIGQEIKVVRGEIATIPVGPPGPIGPPPTIVVQSSAPVDHTVIWIDSDDPGFTSQVQVGGTQPISTLPWVWFDTSDGDLQLIYEDGL